jgi:hypothetical protein
MYFSFSEVFLVQYFIWTLRYYTIPVENKLYLYTLVLHFSHKSTPPHLKFIPASATAFDRLYKRLYAMLVDHRVAEAGAYIEILACFSLPISHRCVSCREAWRELKRGGPPDLWIIVSGIHAVDGETDRSFPFECRGWVASYGLVDYWGDLVAVVTYWLWGLCYDTHSTPNAMTSTNVMLMLNMALLEEKSCDEHRVRFYQFSYKYSINSWFWSLYYSMSFLKFLWWSIFIVSVAKPSR